MKLVMKRLLLNLKGTILVSLMSLSLLANGQEGPSMPVVMAYDSLDGCEVNSSDHYFFYNYSDSSKVFYYEIPNRLFVQKRADVSRDYIIALLNRLIDDECEIRWPYDEICEVIVDGELKDDVVNELLNDDGVLLARHVYVTKSNYSLYLFYPDLEQGEEWIMNEIYCYYSKRPDQALLDSISDALGLILEGEGLYSIKFKTSKSADIFDIAQKLFELGCFMGINPVIERPYTIALWTGKYSLSSDSQETVYYNLSGRRVDSPSGLTIVVTRYIDGSVRTEKKLF